MRYWIIIERGKRNCSAYCPGVPGCVAVGRNVDATIVDMNMALKIHFEGMAIDGMEIPLPAENAREKAAALLKGSDLLAVVDVTVKALASV